MTTSTVHTLRTLLDARRAVIVPGAFNALSARAIADQGFEAVYVSGAGVANGLLGVPDVGLTTLTELADTVSAIRDAVAEPLIVDADTGFGNAVNTVRTVRVLERAGADALQIEDQIFPKKCGHFAGKDVVSAEEIVTKIRAAADARDSLLIIARTDARATRGIEDAIDRANRFVEAGADAVFIEAPESEEELWAITKGVSAPHVANMVIGGRTPVLARERLQELGFSLVLYANAALQGALLGMQAALGRLRTDGVLQEHDGVVASFAERQRLVGKPAWDELERRYVLKGGAED